MVTKNNTQVIMTHLKSLPDVLKQDNTLATFSTNELRYIKGELAEVRQVANQNPQKILEYIEYLVTKILGEVYQNSSSERIRTILNNLLISLQIPYPVSGDNPLLDPSEQEELKNHTMTILDYLGLKIDELLQEDKQPQTKTKDKANNDKPKG